MNAPSTEIAHVQRGGADAQKKVFGCKSPRPCASALKFLLIAAVAVGAPGCRSKMTAAKIHPLAQAYDTESDWNDATKVIPLNYQQAQGKRLFYTCLLYTSDAADE